MLKLGGGSFLPGQQMLREVTAANNILLVVDEVFSFRLGPAGAQGVFGIEPDLTVLGKVIGGGLPVGAIGGSTGRSLL